MPEKLEIRHNLAARRFEVQLEQRLAVLDYIWQGEKIVFTHTGVPFQSEGQGIGSQLVRAGLEYARENSLTVATSCWFVAGFIERHTEYQSLLAP